MGDVERDWGLSIHLEETAGDEVCFRPKRKMKTPSLKLIEFDRKISTTHRVSSLIQVVARPSALRVGQRARYSSMYAVGPKGNPFGEAEYDPQGPASDLHRWRESLRCPSSSKMVVFHSLWPESVPRTHRHPPRLLKRRSQGALSPGIPMSHRSCSMWSSHCASRDLGSLWKCRNRTGRLVGCLER